jgi:hypothetical protein
VNFVSSNPESIPPQLNYEAAPVPRRLTRRDYSNALAEGIGVFLLGLIGTGIIGHVFDEAFTNAIVDALFVVSLYLVPLILGYWQFRRALGRTRAVGRS